MGDYVALVPLRGGSKSIPEKNILNIAGKPLCAWVLEAACLSGVFQKVVVSTDSPKISDVVRNLQLPIEILDRPAELATDDASTESVMLHAAKALSFDVLATIQATSPLLTKQDLQEAHRLFSAGDYDSLLTAVRVKRFFWNDDATAWNYVPHQRPRRQEFGGSFMENGAFYFTKRHILENHRSRLGGRICIYQMPDESDIEIDEPSDWGIVERRLLARTLRSLQETLARIKLLVVDVDGTLTDAGMYWSSEGDQLKKFNTRDAKGLELVRNAGVEVALLTSEDSPIVSARAQKLGITHCFLGIKHKEEFLPALASRLKIGLEDVAYIGDDINDLASLKLSGFSACPSDAVTAVAEAVRYVSKHAGGRGAVREICDMLLASRQ